jgi:hypothetical protein
MPLAERIETRLSRNSVTLREIICEDRHRQKRSPEKKISHFASR